MATMLESAMVQSNSFRQTISSWAETIHHQRSRIAKLLNDMPSLRAKLPAVFEDVYEDALVDAGNETGLGKTAFPETCTWTFDDVLSDFLPE